LEAIHFVEVSLPNLIFESINEKHLAKKPSQFHMTDEKLVRGIGRWDLTAVIINCIIGAGIFGLPSKVYAAIGVYSLVAFVICALVISLIVLCYAEVASRFTSTGGPYLYALEAFGPATAFGVGWLSFVVRVTTMAANTNLLVTYLGFLWPSATTPVDRIIVIAIVHLGLLLVNFVGIRQSSITTNIFTFGKLVPLAAFGLIGIFYIQPGRFISTATPEYSSFSAAVLLLIFAFVGFEVGVVPAGEARNPRRDLPFALLTGLAVVAALYILVQTVSIGTLPELATSERPLADAAVNFIGPIGAGLISVGAVISVLGNLNVGLLAGSRLLFAMGERDELPALFAKTHSRFRTPAVALVFVSSCIFLFTIKTSFISAVAIATITRLLVYTTTCVALPIFRKRENVGEAQFKVPFGVAAAVLSCVLIAWLLTSIDFEKEGTALAIWLGIGFMIFAVMKVLKRRTGSPQLGEDAGA
jgi:amino acid transporter